MCLFNFCVVSGGEILLLLFIWGMLEWYEVNVGDKWVFNWFCCEFCVVILCYELSINMLEVSVKDVYYQMLVLFLEVMLQDEFELLRLEIVYFNGRWCQ